MKFNGRKPRYIFGIWIGITLLSGVASFCGYTIFKGLSQDIIAATIAVAAGGILAMISSTMLPEAFEEAHDFIGVITVLGFLASFILTKLAP
jgi:ZIP family zinc transporter